MAANRFQYGIRPGHLVEICDLVEVPRDPCHPAPASSRGQKHIAVDLCLGGSSEGFALLGRHHPMLKVIHTRRLIALGKIRADHFVTTSDG